MKVFNNLATVFFLLESYSTTGSQQTGTKAKHMGQLIRESVDDASEYLIPRRPRISNAGINASDTNSMNYKP